MTTKEFETHHYRFRNSGRLVIADTNLDHAVLPDGTVDPALLRKGDWRHICDSPTQDLMDLICQAQQAFSTLRSLPPLPQDKKALVAAVRISAKDAADAHAKCLAVAQSRVNDCRDIRCRHIHSTNKGRFAVSKNSLLYAIDQANPDRIQEAMLLEEDLATTCFVTSYDLAVYIATATDAAFNDCTASPERGVRHNEVVRGKPENADVLYIRGNYGYVHLETCLMRFASKPAVLKAFYSAFHYQEALCNTYIAMAQRAG